jgi:hypothetical protein
MSPVTLVTYFHVAPKIWVPCDLPVSGFLLQWVFFRGVGRGSDNAKYQVGQKAVYDLSMLKRLVLYMFLIIAP